MKYLLTVALLIFMLAAPVKSHALEQINVVQSSAVWIPGHWVYVENQYVWVAGYYQQEQTVQVVQQQPVVYIQQQTAPVVYIQQPVVVYRPVISTFAPPIFYGGYNGNSYYNGNCHSGISIHGSFIFRR